MMFKKIIILTVILFIAAAVIYQVNRAYENKLNKMAMDYSYKYLLDLRDHKISDIKKTTLLESEEYVYKAKMLRTIDYAVLPGYLKLNDYPDNEIKEKLKIIKIKDPNTKASLIYSFLRHYSSEYIISGYKTYTKGKNLRTVLFKDGDRSAVILSYYYKGKMYLTPFNILSEKSVMGKYNDSSRFVNCFGNKIYCLKNKKSLAYIGGYEDIIYLDWLKSKKYSKRFKYIVIEDAEKKKKNIMLKIE